MNKDLNEKYDKNKIEQYEELLLERDKAISDAGSHETGYQKEFGEELLDIYELEVECIKLKKIITFIQKKINLGLELDPEELNKEIFKEMEYYKKVIEERLAHLNNCKESKGISGAEFAEIKRIYRNVVKLIHPDVSDVIEKYDEIAEIWEGIYDAYIKNNLKSLREKYLLLRKKLDELNIENNIDIVIENIDEKIDEVRNEIVEIKNSVPYIYIEILNDKEKIKEKHEENEKEKKKYEDYIDELKKAVEDLKKGN